MENSSECQREVQIYSRLNDDKDRYEAGVSAICSVLLNFVETCRYIVYNTRNDRTKTYERFEDRLREISKCNLTFYYTGSQVQNLTAIHWRYPSGSTSHSMGRQCVSDVDVLIVDPTNCASEVKVHCHGNHYIYEYSLDHPGYVRLYRGRGKGKKVISCKGFRKFWKSILDQEEIHTRFTGRGRKFPNRGDMLSGPAITKVENVSMRNFINHDFVPAIKLTSWPSIARDWVSRSRPGNWPSSEVLQQCVTTDCHIVPVGHRESPRHAKNKEWRLSFSGAEIALANSLPHEQRQALIVSKLILKIALLGVLQRKPSLKGHRSVSSYELKTTFYWLRERRSDWGNLSEDVRSILESLAQALHDGCLSDYFLPDKNLLKHTIPDLMTGLCTELETVATNQGLVHHLMKCFAFCYEAELQDVTSLDGYSLRFLHGEIEKFHNSGTPSDKMLLFTVIHLLLDVFRVVFHGAIGNVREIDIKPLLRAIKSIEDGLTKTSKWDKILNKDQLGDLFNEYESFTFDLLTDLRDLVFGVLSDEAVLVTLGDSVWCVVARLFTRHCTAAGLYYTGNQEIIEFAYLLEANPDNSALRETAIQSHGSLEKLQTEAARAHEVVDVAYPFYEGLCQDSLLFYFEVCERFSVGEDFQCEEEKLVLHGMVSLTRDIPKILEDELLGTPRLRQRAQTLLQKLDELRFLEY